MKYIGSKHPSEKCLKKQFSRRLDRNGSKTETHYIAEKTGRYLVLKRDYLDDSREWFWVNYPREESRRDSADNDESALAEAA